MQTSTVVSVGRNIGSEPMSDSDWLGFRIELEQCLEPFGILFAGTGQGSWDGSGEQSHTVICHALAEDEVGQVTSWLADLARSYGQEAIAFTVGATRLIPAA